ncbi:MAG: type II secretion system protein [Vicinamibacterales bacterium]
MRHDLRRGEGGYAMAALLVTLGVMGVVLGMAMPVWRTVVQREKEEELLFRGRQYARAIQLYQRKFAATYPASVDVLVEQRFLRKKYTDPMTKSGEFEILYQGTLAQRQAASMAGRGGTPGGTQPGAGRAGATGQMMTAPGSPFGSQTTGPQGGVVGVASKSKEPSIRILDGRTTYNEWQFIWTPPPATRTGPAGSTGRGGRGAQPGTMQPGAPRGRGPGGAGSPSARPPG